MAETSREERLAALETAVTEWADKKIEAYEKELTFLNSVFSGRTNGGRTADYSVAAASALLEDEINAFLVE